jgi:hypothetical protein
MPVARKGTLWLPKEALKSLKSSLVPLRKDYDLKVFDSVENIRSALKTGSPPDLIVFRPIELSPSLCSAMEAVKSALFPLKWDAVSRKLSWPGERPIELTTKEAQIFSELFLSPNHAVKRKSFFPLIWSDTRVGGKTLDVHLFNLRKKLQKTGVEIVFVPADEFVLRLKSSKASK